MNAPTPPGDSKLSLGGRRRGQRFAQRLAQTRELVGFGEEDEEVIRATRHVLVAQSEAIAVALYAHLMLHRETAEHFKNENGGADRDTVETRHATLREWLAIAIEAPLDANLSGYLAEVGRAHTGRGGKGATPARFLVVAMSFLHTELTDILGDAITEPAALVASISAWSKLLMVHLDLFLAVYASGAGTAHWY